MALRIAVSGAVGRMGRRVVSLVIAEPDTELACACEREGHPDLGRDAGELAGCGPAGIRLTDGIGGNPEVIVDFSSPEGAAVMPARPSLSTVSSVQAACFPTPARRRDW